ncbi:hypothetical protein ACFQ2M_14165 [Kitasatospora saccharophila]|uniref:hypothetical protein n=1 Tax=Kitasatospora saccharophila TaxID=407973 RepID=UPI00362C1C84
MRKLTVDTACIFYPRGGSAQVVRYLNRELAQRGHRTRVLVGSLGDVGDTGHALTFYRGLTVRPHAYDQAHARWKAGSNPQEGVLRPFHPPTRTAPSPAPAAPTPCSGPSPTWPPSTWKPRGEATCAATAPSGRSTSSTSTTSPTSSTPPTPPTRTRRPSPPCTAPN